MVYFLQHWRVPWQICHGTERVWHIIYSLFIPLSLSYLFHLLFQQFLTASISTLSHISLFFSFSPIYICASISTLPHSFFFPFPFCSIFFPFMNMSHHRFPLYHHWSNLSLHRFFFPLFVRSLLSVLSQSRLSGCGFVTLDCGFVTSDCDQCGSLGCGYLLCVLSWVADSLFVVLRASIRCSISEGFIDSPWAKLVSSIRSPSRFYFCACFFSLLNLKAWTFTTNWLSIFKLNTIFDVGF